MFLDFGLKNKPKIDGIVFSSKLIIPLRSELEEFLR